jgi:putative SOS response-associated peptidase YedK
MITTEPNRVAATVHDRMPSYLERDQIEPFLAGDTKSFAPDPELLAVADAANPLVKV